MKILYLSDDERCIHIQFDSNCQAGHPISKLLFME